VAKKISVLTILSLLFLAGGVRGNDSSNAIHLSLQPEHILMGAGYNGKQISISGTIPSEAEALVRVTGKAEHSKLKQKGRALGFLWMNLGSVEISNVPSIFLLYLPGSFHEAKEGDQQNWQNLGIGLQSIRQRASIIAQNGNHDQLFDEYVKLKKKSGLYDIAENSVHYGPENGGKKSFNAKPTLPAALPQGIYQIEVFAIKDDKVEASAVHNLDAREIGEPAWISSLAYKHGILYGILSVLAAVIVGLLTGFLFKGEKGAH